MRPQGPVPPWALAVTAILVVQLSIALSVGLIEIVGPAGSASLRLLMGAIIVVVIARPPWRSVRRHDVPTLVMLGTVMGLMSVTLQFSIERIPLGTAVAIEFLGPLTLAAIRSSQRRMLVWPALAFIGVVCMTAPWEGDIDLVGVAFAVAGGTCWAIYILLTQKVGDRFDGLSALSLTIPIAAVVAACIGLPQAWGHIDGWVLLYATALALGIPVIAFALELSALRRMTHTAFGTLMALEPAFGVLLGLIVLFQVPNALQVLGIVLVVIAGVAAQQDGIRQPETELENEARGLPS